MELHTGHRGEFLKRVALVVIAVVGIGVVAPITTAAATAYFSQVKTVKVTVYGDSHGGRDHYDQSVWETALCPAGYKVTGGGFAIYDPFWVMAASTPTANASGRQGWQLGFAETSNGEETIGAYVYAQCVR